MQAAGEVPPQRAGPAPPVGPWLAAWIGSAAVVGLAAPAGTLLAHRGDADVRRALGPPLLVLLGQIGVERALTARGRGDTIRAVGAAGTLLRLAMMVRARRRLSGRPAPRAASVVLDANLAFWIANLAVLTRSG